MKMTLRDWILDTLAVLFWAAYLYFSLVSLGELLFWIWAGVIN